MNLSSCTQKHEMQIKQKTQLDKLYDYFAHPSLFKTFNLMEKLITVHVNLTCKTFLSAQFTYPGKIKVC